MSQSVEAFYDEFSAKFVEDIVEGNERVEQQFIFLSRAIPSSAQSVLVIGCGSGQGAHFIATNVAVNAKVLAVDISTENLRLARSVFEHPQIEYRQVDVTADPLEGEWDAIVLPDVYEHIPTRARPVLHAKFDRLLSKNGRILFTVPSPGKQASLYATGKGLQVVDEIVTLEDLNQVARDVNGVLTYFNMISVWETNDYIHAVVERGAEAVGPIDERDRLPIKGWTQRSFWKKASESLKHRSSFNKLQQNRHRKRIQKQLAEKAGRS